MAQLEAELHEMWIRDFEQTYMRDLRAFLRAQRQAGKRVFPAGTELFAALQTTPLDRVKVVIVGQDPYHGEGQAHGLSFSVKRGVAVPPSLHNIYKEIHTELDLPIPRHGDLTSWAEQGVLLLNSVLSVECALPGSHRSRGWETFTDRVIDVVNRQCEGIVFMLWGSYAQRKGSFIDAARHCVLKASHPSPLSAYRGFFGCGHFLAANDYLQRRGAAPIDWRLPQ